MRMLTGIFRTFQPGTFGTFPRFSWTFPTNRGRFHNIRNFFNKTFPVGAFSTRAGLFPWW